MWPQKTPLYLLSIGTVMPALRTRMYGSLQALRMCSSLWRAVKRLAALEFGWRTLLHKGLCRLVEIAR